MASVPSWSFKSFCLEEHLACKIVSCGGGTALLFLSSLRTCPFPCVVRDEQAPLIAVAHLRELESQSLASREYSLITLLTLLLIKTTKHRFSKSSGMWHVCACSYVFLCMSRSMCATAQVCRSGDNLQFQAPLSTLFERGSLYYLFCVHADCVALELVSVSHLTLGAEYRCSLPHLALHASWGFEHRSSHLHSKYFIHWALPYIKHFWVQVGLEIMVHDKGWLRYYSLLEANTGPLTGLGQLGLPYWALHPLSKVQDNFIPSSCLADNLSTQKADGDRTTSGICWEWALFQQSWPL